MVALRHSWQEQRQRRQQELAQRRQQVQVALAVVRQERESKAAQVRNQLNTFRIYLADETALWQVNQQLFRLELQESVQTLRQETRDFLAYSQLERQIQAEEVTQRLEKFVQALRQEMTQFLSLTAAERSLMTEQVTQELRTFHTELTANVADLRQTLQADLAFLHHTTQADLATHQRQRAEMRSQQIQAISAFVEQLRDQVQAELWELSLIRQDRAQQLQHTLAHSRNQRQAQVNQLFQQLANFRAELRQYCTNLQAEVWGDVERPSSVQSAAIASQPTPTIVTPAASQPTTVTQTEAAREIDVEKAIYNYLHEVQGARLAELETVLILNRIQAVDGLRSLITKGLITQRDRVYYTLEELSL